MYLRTFRRRPTDAELARARAHVRAAGDPARGLRDLLWALLNIKIDPAKEYRTPTGRPVAIVCNGTPIKELFGWSENGGRRAGDLHGRGPASGARPVGTFAAG